MPGGVESGGYQPTKKDIKLAEEHITGDSDAEEISAMTEEREWDSLYTDSYLQHQGDLIAKDLGILQAGGEWRTKDDGKTRYFMSDPDFFRTEGTFSFLDIANKGKDMKANDVLTAVAQKAGLENTDLAKKILGEKGGYRVKFKLYPESNGIEYKYVKIKK